MYNRFWWIEMIRGVLALAFGLVYLSLHTVFYLLIALLGIYLLADGCFDVFRIVRGKLTPLRHLSFYLGAALSISLGLLCLVNVSLVLTLLSIVFLLRLIIRGFQVFGDTRRRQGRGVGLYWLYGLGLILAGLFCLVPAIFVLIPALLFLFLSIYALGDGLYLIGRGFHLRTLALPGASRSLKQVVANCALALPERPPAGARLALIFVRRGGASGLGHVGWAFEWENGWFNAGSVENYGNHAFAPAGHADFWTAQTNAPVETMLSRYHAYDEYKVFFVPEPHPDAAWQVVAWASRQPYRVVHRNCVDTTYDVLRAYGLADLPDPVTEYAPNDWYDSLAGRSYPVGSYPLLPERPEWCGLSSLPAREIALTIPKTLPGTVPAWRAVGSGLRGLVEIELIWQKMLHDVQAVLVFPRKWRERTREEAG